LSLVDVIHIIPKLITQSCAKCDPSTGSHRNQTKSDLACVLPIRIREPVIDIKSSSRYTETLLSRLKPRVLSNVASTALTSARVVVAPLISAFFRSHRKHRIPNRTRRPHLQR